VYQALDLSQADIAQLARNSIRASFLSAAEKSVWMQRIDQFVATA
jgi:adenosine deaminase